MACSAIENRLLHTVGAVNSWGKGLEPVQKLYDRPIECEA